MNRGFIERMKRVAQMEELWSRDASHVDLTSILDTLRREGLYSKATNDRDAVYSLNRIIEVLQVVIKELCKKRRRKPRLTQEKN